MSGQPLPAVGTRIVHSGHLGTVKFVGEVEGTQGMWLGVEWDDPSRGRHSGSKGGRQYFTCLVPNSGSFIRPTSAISYGTTFLKALVSKYVEATHGPSVEKVLLGSSNGAIEVEAVNLDKIRHKLSNLQRLREVSLDNEGVATSDPPGEIRKTCPGIRGLDLSKSLLPSWDVVALIVDELPVLEALRMNYNRLVMPSDMLKFKNAFAKIQELQINSTLICWRDITTLLTNMPALRFLEAGYNQLRALSPAEHGAVSYNETHPNMQVVNLDTNRLCDWGEICAAMRIFPGLERLILSGNHIQAIDDLSKFHPGAALLNLKHLSLTENGLTSWEDIDRLTLWCPELESLTLRGNPLAEDPEHGAHARQFVIAKISTLKVLDATAISSKERTDCELFYLSYISKHGPIEEDARRRQHPRWKELCNKHGISDVLRPPVAERHDTLANRLIELNVRRCTEPPSGTEPAVLQSLSVKVLPTMSVRTFRLKLAKSFKLGKAEQAAARLWLRLPDGTYRELDFADDTKELDWWGLEHGNDLFLLAM